MQRSFLLFATVATLLITGFVLYRVTCHHGHGHAISRDHRDPLASSAGMNFRQSQPTHWRAMLMR